MNFLRILFLGLISLAVFSAYAQELPYLKNAEQLIRAEKYSQAEEILVQRRKQLTDKGLFLLSQVYQATQRRYDALYIINQLVERSENNYELRWMRANLFMEVAAFDLALDDLDFLRSNPSTSTSYIFFEYDPNGLQPTHAFTLYDQQGRIVINSGYCKLKLSRYSDAIEDFRIAEPMRKQPNLYVYWSEAYLQQQDKANAIQILKKGLSNFPESEEIWSKYIEIQPTVNIPLFLIENPNYLPLIKQRIVKLLDMQAFSLAFDLLSKAMQIYPTESDLWELKCRLEIKVGRLSEAENVCKQLIKLKENNATAFFLLGQIQYKQKKYDKAITNYDFAVMLDPEYSAAWINLGITYLVLENKKKGCEAISKGVELGAEAGRQVLDHCGF